MKMIKSKDISFHRDSLQKIASISARTLGSGRAGPVCIALKDPAPYEYRSCAPDNETPGVVKKFPVT